jgi:cell wall-associated NlpC family hydrolase
MKRILSILFIVTFVLNAKSQILEFDELELRYDQGHYKNVYRKALRLLDKPEYDFSYLPEYYIALSKLQLAQNEGWLKRHKYAIVEAKRTFQDLQRTNEGRELLKRHEYEISSLKNDLQMWLTELKLDNNKAIYEPVNELLSTIFSKVPNVSSLPDDKVEQKEEIEVNITVDSVYNEKSGIRTNIITGAQEFLGVPYKWAGNDPNGFDCSGFTCYVMKNEANQVIPRRTSDQFNSVKKIKRKNVQPGDFVFFKNGSSISHVGIVFTTNQNSIQMIHASSSVGISIVDIYQSAYWSKRIAGFGTFIED